MHKKILNSQDKSKKDLPSYIFSQVSEISKQNKIWLLQVVLIGTLQLYLGKKRPEDIQLFCACHLLTIHENFWFRVVFLFANSLF